MSFKIVIIGILYFVSQSKLLCGSDTVESEEISDDGKSSLTKDFMIITESVILIDNLKHFKKYNIQYLEEYNKLVDVLVNYTLGPMNTLQAQCTL